MCINWVHYDACQSKKASLNFVISAVTGLLVRQEIRVRARVRVGVGPRG